MADAGPLKWDQASHLVSLIMTDVGVTLQAGDWVTVPIQHPMAQAGRTLAKVRQLHTQTVSSAMDPGSGFAVIVWLEVEVRGLLASFRPVVRVPLKDCSPFPARRIN